MSYTEVLFEEQLGEDGNLGIITLNRPQVLNSLNHAMIQAIYNKLAAWESAPDIKAVVIRAVEGRAFCAGGDLRFTYERMKAGNPNSADFFYDEYQLNRKIFHYKKPYIALLDGITMGGGVGISIHGSHRVGTDRLLFSMPETGIGFFPDVGGSYFLPRIKGQLGYYLGLTGARINCDDCAQLGIINYKIAQTSLPELIHELAQQSFANDAKKTVSKIIEQFTIPLNDSSLIQYQQVISTCFNGNTMEDIMAALQQTKDELAYEISSMLSKKSPTSLKVSLKAMQEGRLYDFDFCMRQEFRLVTRFLRGHDFVEGIRAVIMDKDQAPNWQPASLEAVSEQEVYDYFAPISQELV